MESVYIVLVVLAVLSVVGFLIKAERTVKPKLFLHYCEGSRPQIRFPSLKIQPRDWESTGNLTWKASRI